METRPAAEPPIRLVVGLGNPGPRYRRTRHNAGFLVVERVAAARGVRFRPAPLGEAAAIADGVTLFKPRTFMNRSGQAVAAWARRHRLDAAEILVVADDLDLPPGTVRLRRRGSSGGHRGLQSIIECLGSQDFPRIKVGIGHPPPGIEVVDWVLGTPEGETEWWEAALDQAARTVEWVLTEGFAAAAARAGRG